MYRDSDNLDALCEDLAVALAKHNPYQRKAVFEEALLRWDLETRRKMSSSATNQGLWVKMESFALKDLLMRIIKKGHNQRRYSKDGKPLGQNMNMVVNALLGSHAQGQHAEQHSTIMGGVTSEDPLGEEAKEAPEEKEQRA